jgi:WD40 repeat protein
VDDYSNACSLSVSSDGRHAVSGCSDSILRVWDIETGACLRTLEGHSDGVNSVSVSPDGRRAVSVSYNYTVRLWDLDTGECLRTLEDHRSGVTSMCVSPDGCRAISGSLSKPLRVWDLGTGKCLSTLEDHGGDFFAFSCVSVSSDWRRAVSARTNILLARPGMGKSAYALHWLKAMDIEGTLWVWDLETGQCLRTLEGHDSKVNCVSVSPDGRCVVSGSEDKTLRVWDLETGQCLAVYHAGADVRSVTFSPNGNRIVCGTEDGQMHFLTPVNFPPSSPPIITAVRLWHFGDNGAPGRWDERLTALCLCCGQRFPVRDDMLGQQIACPLESCGKPLQMNPFVASSEHYTSSDDTEKSKFSS